MSSAHRAVKVYGSARLVSDTGAQLSAGVVDNEIRVSTLRIGGTPQKLCSIRREFG
jgi:hypothetical protein